jgi:hypothetical protein
MASDLDGFFGMTWARITKVLYGCETWSLSVREEHRLRVLEDRMLRIFRPTREEVVGGWRRLHNEELHNLCTSPILLG